MRGAWWVAAAVTALCAHAAYSGLRLLPDFDLYTQGGVGLYPSPIGRLLGSLGGWPFAALSVAAAAACVLLVARRSSAPGLAALAFSAVSWPWLVMAGIDSIGLAVFLAAATWRPALYLLAPLTHTAVAPYVLLELRKLRPVVALTLAFFLVPSLLLAVLATPYSGVIYGLADPGFLTMLVLATIGGLALASPMLLVLAPRRGMLLPFLAGGVCCALQVHFQARYFMPALALTAMQAEGLRWPIRLRLRWRTDRGETGALVLGDAKEQPGLAAPIPAIAGSPAGGGLTPSGRSFRVRWRVRSRSAAAPGSSWVATTTQRRRRSR